MMEKIAYQITFSALALALTGCATAPQNCNVHAKDESLLTKMACGEEYRKAPEIAQQKLDEEIAINEAFKKVYADLQLERAAVGKSLKERQQAEKQAQVSLNAMLGKVKARQGSKAEVKQQIADLEKRLQTQSTLPATTSPSVLKQREKERDALRSQVQQLQLSLGY